MNDSMLVSKFIETMQEIFADHEVMVHEKESCTPKCQYNQHFANACTLFANLAGPLEKGSDEWDSSRHVRERFRKKVTNAVLYH